MKQIQLAFFTSLLCVGVASSVFAATDGTSGTTSTGSATVQVVIPKLVKISSMSDFIPGVDYDGGSAGFNENHDVCIYANLGGAGKYTVNASATYDDGSSQTGFAVGNHSNAQSVAYTVKWRDSSGTGGSPTTLGHASDSVDHVGFSNVIDCSGTPNANIQVQMTQANLLAVKNGTYASTLTILITPQ